MAGALHCIMQAPSSAPSSSSSSSSTRDSLANDVRAARQARPVGGSGGCKWYALSRFQLSPDPRDLPPCPFDCSDAGDAPPPTSGSD